MPMSLTYTADGGILSRGEGIVTGSEIKEVNDIIYQSPQKIKEIAYQLCDLTDVSQVSISNAEIEEIAIQDKNAFAINPNMFIAVVAQKDLLFGLSRMWEAFGYGSAVDAMVFREMKDAQQWIRDKWHKKT